MEFFMLDVPSVIQAAKLLEDIKQKEEEFKQLLLSAPSSISNYHSYGVLEKMLENHDSIFSLTEELSAIDIPDGFFLIGGQGFGLYEKNNDGFVRHHKITTVCHGNGESVSSSVTLLNEVDGDSVLKGAKLLKEIEEIEGEKAALSKEKFKLLRGGALIDPLGLLKKFDENESLQYDAQEELNLLCDNCIEDGFYFLLGSNFGLYEKSKSGGFVRKKVSIISPD